jgi:hypothetical protein
MATIKLLSDAALADEQARRLLTGTGELALRKLRGGPSSTIGPDDADSAEIARFES